MNQVRLCVLFLLFFSSAAISLRAQETSRAIPFDDVLTKLHPMTEQDVTIQLWDDDLGGTLIYSEAHPQTKVDSQRQIDFLFGSGKPGGLDPLDFPSGSSRYVDVVDSKGRSVLPARLPLRAVAFALSPGPQGPPGPQGDPGPRGPGSVVQVNSGPGIIGGPITTIGTLSLDTSLTNSLYARLGASNIFTGDQAINGSFSARILSSGQGFARVLNLGFLPYAGNGSPVFSVEADTSTANPNYAEVSSLSLLNNGSGGSAVRISTNTQSGQALEVDCTLVGTDCEGVVANGTHVGGIFSGPDIGVAGSGKTGGMFNGDVNITGTLTKGAGAFKIDHPLDPANKYLTHSFVESPDMMDIYNGTVLLDGNGETWVNLPDWFEALNRDFRYQLTAMGAPSPNLYIAEEVSGNRFKIAGGQSGGKVSWQVTGIRHDAYADAHRLPVEEDKPEEDRGYYLHPEVHGQPATRSVLLKRLPAKR
jgi:hypothetical protein